MIFIALLVAYIALDAIQDTIDHHKAAMALRDFWHLVRHGARLCLFFTGAFGFYRIQPWYIYVIAVASLVPLKLLLWDTIYNKCWKRLVHIDNQLKISFGVKWIDKLMGFHH